MNRLSQPFLKEYFSIGNEFGNMSLLQFSPHPPAPFDKLRTSFSNIGLLNTPISSASDKRLHCPLSPPNFGGKLELKSPRIGGFRGRTALKNSIGNWCVLSRHIGRRGEKPLKAPLPSLLSITQKSPDLLPHNLSKGYSESSFLNEGMRVSARSA